MSKKEKIVPITSAATEKEQSKIVNKSIAEKQQKSNLQAAENLKNFEQGVLETITMEELYDTVYPPKAAVVDKLIYNGTYLFVGAPKIGKSFLMAQLGYHISMGLPLWNYQVNQGSVLYLALEDDYARIQKRLSRMFGMESTPNFHFATKSKALNEGLEEQLANFMKEHPDTKLIMIDTLQKVREINGDRYNYSNDYDIVMKLKQFSEKHNICMLIVHHTRKLQSEDCFDMISGTNGLLGAADGAFILQKTKRIDNKGILDIVGRDQQDQRIYLEFDREKCLWKFVKMETELCKEPLDPVVKMVGEIVTKNKSDWIGTASELAALLPKEISPNALTRRLNVNAERLLEEFSIYYQTSRTRTGRQIKLTLTKK